VGTEIPKDSVTYSLIVPINYRKFIENASNLDNLVIFHSSDLPKGRGWAPIAYTILENRKFFTITAFTPNEKIDDGNIVLKVSFEMQYGYTAKLLRLWDIEIMLICTRLLIEKFQNSPLRGITQPGDNATYNKRRYPEMGEIDPNTTLRDSFELLRSSEEGHPCFTIINGVKFKIFIEPEQIPAFPEHILVEIPALGEKFELNDYVSETTASDLGRTEAGQLF
jgi:methionyl-tRNA formyltransferase